MAVTAQQRRDVRGEGSCGAADIASRHKQTNTGRLEGQCCGYVRTELFAKKQFVRRAACGRWGYPGISTITSKFVERNEQEYSGTRRGKETVRNTFRRKRQAAQNSMKLAFRGKCGSAKNQT
jgi:uncharacterized low-complexity protein